MNKEDYKTLEEIKRLDDTLLNEIERKETGIKILEAEIRQLYDFINEVQRLAELETIRIEDRKSKEKL